MSVSVRAIGQHGTCQLSVLEQILDDPNLTFTVGWLGTRYVSSARREECLRVDSLVEQYFSSRSFTIKGSESLQERMKCFDLWPKVRDLCLRSDERANAYYQELTKMKGIGALFKHLKPQSYVHINQEEIIRVNNWEVRREDMFGFTRRQFLEIWPGVQKARTRFYGGETVDIVVYATRDMVASGIQRGAVVSEPTMADFS